MRDNFLTLTRLAYVRDLARAPSMTEAAELSGVTLGTLSHELSEIEKHLGFPICDRESRPVQLNAAGRSLAEAASDVLERVTRAPADASAVKANEDKQVGLEQERHRAAEGVARSLAAMPADTATLGTLKGKSIAVEEPTALSAPFAAVVEAFGLEVLARSNDSRAFGIWPHKGTALRYGTIDFYLEWSCKPDLRVGVDGALIAVPLGDDPVQFVLVSEDDPLAAKRSIGVAALKRRWSHTIELRNDMLLDKLMKYRLSHNILVDFATARRSGCLFAAIVPSSMGHNPPKGFASVPCKALETPATLFLVLRTRMTNEELHEARILAGALHSALLGRSAAAARVAAAT